MAKAVVRDTEFLRVFGAKIKMLREQREWSVYKLSAVSGIPRNQIHLIEKGVINTSISVIPLLCKAFKIEISELMKIDYSI